jgi:hypothetical protein
MTMNTDKIVTDVTCRATELDLTVSDQISVEARPDDHTGGVDIRVRWGSDAPTAGEIATFAQAVREVVAGNVRVKYTHPVGGVLANQTNDTLQFVRLAGLPHPNDGVGASAADLQKL